MIAAGDEWRPARLAGLLYLGTILFGVFAEMGTRGTLIAHGDPAATAASLDAHRALFRTGLLADLAMLACYGAVTGLFHAMFGRRRPLVSLVAAITSVIGLSVLASTELLLLAALRLLPGPAASGPSPDGVRDAAVLFCLRLHGDGYALSLVFFGIYCGLLGWLVRGRSASSRMVSALMWLAGACYLVNSLSILAAPVLARALPDAIMVPTLVGEAALSAWLLLGGRSEPHPRQAGA
ncbi:DUF4386 domain-containing protein [Rhizosaccharibacter radicis]|uniref:DUF4386 domain-containing protein n=1 Tax=Rhizosaccharibacter radicis TaxID=2782605 RepID=A0ABT1VZL2_9PROT|nr:DUF4386 domain-containing protein [Acetobacteraceae bacterium KSS12]